MIQKTTKTPPNPSRLRRQAADLKRGSRSTIKRLDDLLYQVGLVDQSRPLPDFWSVYEMVRATYPERPVAAARGQKVYISSPVPTEKALNKALQICLKDQPALAQHLESRRQEKTPKPLGEPWYWYLFIRDALSKLEQLVKGESVLSVGGPIRKDSEGFFVAARDHFAEAMDGVDSRYLRQCEREDCRRIFFANRINQPCCSPKCGNVVRNRKLRSRRAEESHAGTRKLTPSKEQMDSVRAALRGFRGDVDRPRDRAELADLADVTVEQLDAVLKHDPTLMRKRK